MIKLTIGGENADLPQKFSVEVEDTNPVFNDRGSQSVPATVPATPRNLRLLGFPTRLDTAVDPNNPRKVVTLTDGTYTRSGRLNVTSAGIGQGITANVGFDNSNVYSEWADKKLSELSSLPVLKMASVDAMVDYLEHIYRLSNPSDELAVFPIAVAKEDVNENDTTHTYWEVLNAPEARGLSQPLTISRVIDGTVTEVDVPAGYGITPFVRVWAVLEYIFEDLGVQILNNPFHADEDLRRLVVLNNTADAICTSVLKYAELMPDVTVSEFMHSLWVRFGLVYHVDFDASTVNLKFIRDIIREPELTDFLPMATTREVINYETARYVKLSAKTSLEGAAPPAERYEDFIAGLDTQNIHLGFDVALWKYVPKEDVWDGDVREDYWEVEDPDWEDPEPPEPWEEYDPWDQDRDDNGRDDWDEYDDRDYDRDDYGSRSAAAPAKSARQQSASSCFIAKEFVSGKWYKIDDTNKIIKLSGSGFFCWDPASTGLDSLDLSSEDECVPVGRVNTPLGAVGPSFSGYCPIYITGARHYHSYIEGAETEGESTDTPLAFMWAYQTGHKTIGRLNPEGQDGLPLKLDDGSSPKLSLLFQFKDGLFSQFWSGYDEILRHGNRVAELRCRIDKSRLLRLDMLQPVCLRGARCLIDTITYSLPAPGAVDALVKLRTIATHGSYDIADEQNIPDFSVALRHLGWRLLSDNMAEMGNLHAGRQTAVDEYIKRTGYNEHESGGVQWCVVASGAIPVETRKWTGWENDLTLPTPGASGRRLIRYYKCRITYDIYEATKNTHHLSETPIGQQTITAAYKVELVSDWFAD